METLFPLEPVFPPGFLYFPEFVSEEEEKDLVARCEQLELHNFQFQGYEANRKVASFGYDYRFEDKTLKKGLPIPDFFKSIVDKVADKVSVLSSCFKELLVTEYPTGSVIGWHRDAFPFEIIAGISLLTDCKFHLRPWDKAKHNKNNTISFTVQRRSLYLIRGEARYGWQHSISPVKNRRFSITLRTLIKE